MAKRISFSKPKGDEPEINLIPFIDVLLVVLIFLMLSTTYSRFTELQVKLPVADADVQREYPRELIVVVGVDGRYAVNKTAVEGRSVEQLASALRAAAGEAAQATSTANVRDVVVVISADALASHQSVITVMEAAKRAGLAQITFATQNSAQAGK